VDEYDSDLLVGFRVQIQVSAWNVAQDGVAGPETHSKHIITILIIIAASAFTSKMSNNGVTVAF